MPATAVQFTLFLISQLDAKSAKVHKASISTMKPAQNDPHSVHNIFTSVFLYK